MLAKSKEYRSNNRDRLLQRDKDRYWDNRDERLKAFSEAYYNLKHQVYKAYGGKCSCCDESEILFLQIDHVNND